MDSSLTGLSGSEGSRDDLPVDWSALIVRAKDGCDDSFQDMVERVYNYLILVAGARIRQRVQGKFGASDIVQHGLSQAHNSLGEFNGSSEAEFRAWVRAIVVNSLRNHDRHFDAQKREVEREHSLSSVHNLGHGDDTPSAIAVLNEEKHLLQRYMMQLPALEQRVIEMRHRFGYQQSEIAEILGISETKVKSTFKSGIDQLKRWFKENEGLLDSTEISFE